jgi:hypothetical protein
MKVAYKKFNNVVQFPIQKRKSRTADYIVQLTINLAALYMANDITIDIWRSLTGH